MARDEATLHGIETRALARLVAIGAQEIDEVKNIQEFDLGHFPEIKKKIGIILGVEGGKSRGEIARNTVSQGVSLRVVLTVNVLKTGSEKEKRAASLPIVEGIIKALIFQDLGLQMDALRLNSFKYKTSPDALMKGFIIWEILFDTFLNYEKQDLEQYDDLNEIFLEYCLQDGTLPTKEDVHAEDLIELPTE